MESTPERGEVGAQACAVAEFFSDLVRSETRLYNALGARLREAHGIVTSQFEFLRFVRDHSDVRVADLAAEFAIGIGATSKLGDRLELSGWIERVPNPADRRSSLLTLTETGRALMDAAERTFDEGLEELLWAALTPAQLAAAGKALAALRRSLERMGAGTPSG
ncbi:MarR family transcriptional regulator [Microbacterium sp. STN6]|uniref:MarR family winged helix-turn-helix transcriptional regulator n=1 Tax=Microbacterium sp. STN6 TaxID=2995588 RepID=UPI002260DAD4|nr:MarR family transcriptional regulator [Microbacterium sp. STN6]MCX7522063.1 MarR family transcriptional regulator [Microbacterium sp. STN6]